MKKLIFFGNYFYGLCAVALSLEASYQLQLGRIPIIYYLFIFLATVVFYSKAYITETINTQATERSLWYAENRKHIINQQIWFAVIAVAICILLLPNVYLGLKKISLVHILFTISFLLVGLLYYGFSRKISLRNTHWLKPFIIGYVWAGVVTLLPIIYVQLQDSSTLHFSNFGILLFIKNLMFVAVLSIMFDIKDYATDFNQNLKTFVVSFGLKKTIFFILIPLIIIGFGVFLLYTIQHHFSVARIGINSIPFIGLLLVAFSLHKRKSIFYYLIMIDGLMLLKALCGIVSTQF